MFVDLSIALLVLISVGLTIVEMTGAMPADSIIHTVIQALTVIFVVELILRYACARTTNKFIREHWMDIIAVLPAFANVSDTSTGVQYLLLLRLLRLFRVLRLFGVINRLATHYPFLFRRGVAEYILVFGMLLVTVILGTGGMIIFENVKTDEQVQKVEDENAEKFTVHNSFWFSVYSLLAGEPVLIEPKTTGGRIVSVFVMIMGLFIFATLTGTISAYMVERFRLKGKTMELDDFENHLVICGWNQKARIIIEEYQANKHTKSTWIVVITELDLETNGIPDYVRNKIAFIQDDFTKVSALESARIYAAKTCIILADTSGGRSEQDADARTILAALTVEKINPAVDTCAELIDRMYGSHLDMGHVNDYVVSGEYSAYMIAQASMQRGLMDVLGELLTCQRGQTFLRKPVPSSWFGKGYSQVLNELKTKNNATLVAVHSQENGMVINPSSYEFSKGDEVVMISERDVEL